MKHLILAIFVLHMIILTFLNNAYIAGLPLRSFIIVLCGILVIFESSTYVTELKLLNWVYFIMGGTGVIISVYNSVLLGEIFSGTIRLLQSWLIIISAYYLTVQFSYKALLYTVLLVAIPSSLVGIMQYLDIDAAWNLRVILGSFQNTESIQTLNASFVENRIRPPGLTLFAITQGYLLITAIALLLLAYNQNVDKGRGVFFVFITLIILYAGILSSETRSAIGAVTLMMLITFLKNKPTATVIIAVMLSIFAVTAYQYTASEKDNGSRVTSFDDQSAQGRLTLYKYGLELAGKKPLGYGYGFDSVETARKYFINEQNWFDYGYKEKGPLLVAIHNAVLNVTHTFGVIGLLVFLIYIFNLARLNWFFLLVLSSYLLNSFFHNSGILNGDLYIDIFIAIMLYNKYRIPISQKISSPESRVALQQQFGYSRRKTNTQLVG